MPIIIEEYQPIWRERFQQLYSTIWPSVKDISISMEHVGSTSVPGLAAKPIIDVDIIISATDLLPEIISRLAKLGYEHRGDQGVPLREAFRHQKPDFPHHLYVCIEGCLSLQNHLLLRDHLRQNLKARTQYGALKKKLAAQFPNDINSYVEGKTDFVLHILLQYGIDEKDLSAVQKVNKNPNKSRA